MAAVTEPEDDATDADEWADVSGGHMRRTLSFRAWRAVWYGSLDSERRRLIRRAVNRGQALSRPDDAAVAVELARRMQGPTWWLIPFMGLPMLFLVGFVAVNYWQLMDAWSRANVTVWALGGVVGPSFRAWRYRHWRRAEHVNQAVLDAAGDR